MIDIKFEDYKFRIKQQNGKDYVFDTNRKRWVTLTPEEWVRQNIIQYLIQSMHYPGSLISVEKEVKLGDLRKRFDIVIYKQEQPWMIVECKEMNVELTEATIRQILNYNITLQVKFLVITNGRQTFALALNNGSFEWLSQLPVY